MSELYKKVEAEFAARKDALCENTSPAECNCSACPARQMCEWLCSHSEV